MKGGRHIRYDEADAAGQPAPDAARQGRRPPRLVRRQQGQGRRAVRAAVADDDVAMPHSRDRLCCCRARRQRRGADARRWRMRPRRWIAPPFARCSQQHADVNAPQVDGMTALHWAAYHDDLERRKLLVARRRRREGGEPLRRHAALARLHERQRGDGRAAAEGRRRPERARCPAARPPLMTAARTGQARRGEGAARARRRRQRQGRAARADRPDVGGGRRPCRRSCEALHRGGRGLPHARCASGFTPLLFAVREGRIDVVRCC